MIITFLLLAAGLFVLIELFFGFTGILPALNFGTFSSDQWWAIIGMGAVFLSWFLFYLGVIMKGL
ncbi:MAG: hypothetical protein ACFE96_18120 [Candidatus Hermodarchaeota archaeon]